MGAPGTNGSSPIGEPVGPHRDLNTSIRRRAAVVYLVMAMFGVGIVWAAGVPALWLTIVAPLVVLAAMQFVAGWDMKVTDMEAIGIASQATGFTVGHASGSLGFRGPLAKPVWQILAYGAGPVPTEQAVVAVDALNGEVRGIYEEAVEAA